MIDAKDKAALLYIVRNASRIGDEFADVAAFSGFSPAKLRAIAKKYDGHIVRIGGRAFRIEYQAPEATSMAKSAPGINNPRTGIGAPIRAMVAVVPLKVKK